MSKRLTHMDLEARPNTAFSITSAPGIMWVGFFLMHVPLAVAMNQINAIATLHALVTILAALWMAAFGQQPMLVIYSAAYITGAEIVWRMNNAAVFWESGKYAIIAILAIGAVRFYSARGSRLPVLYFVFLLPSIILTIFDTDLGTARDALSFNLSGPLALAVCAWFFSKTRLSNEETRTLMLSLMSPVVAVATKAVYSTLSTSRIDFTDESNLITSGGFGPNQVSNILGLGALFCILFVMRERENIVLRLGWSAGAIMFATVSALTFSRSGLYNAGAAAAAFILFKLHDMRLVSRVIVPTVAVILLAAIVIVPRLDTFTNGAFSTRFQDTGLSQRVEIAQADLGLWVQNPIAGVGPGQASSARSYGSEKFASHTEFSRLLAEHGSLGILSMLVLLVMAVRNIISTRTANDRALIAALQVWAFFFFLNSAMRMAAPAFVFGLAFALAREEDPQSGDAPTTQDDELLSALIAKSNAGKV